MKRKLFVIASCIGLVTIASSSVARETVVTGTVGVGLDFWDRSYDSEEQLISEGILADEDEGDKREFGIWPEVTITSQGVRDSLAFRYAPVFKYDDVSSENEIDHYLDLLGDRSITRNWTVSLENKFQQTDDPALRSDTTSLDAAGGGEAAQETTTTQETATSQEVQPGDELTRDAGRQRYWINNLIAQTRYSFGEEKSLGGGYGFKVLRNDSELNAYREYDRHNLFADMKYRHSQSIRSIVILDYVKGLYDDTEDPETELPVSNDLDEYRATLGMDYLHSVHDFFPFAYNFVGVKYDNEIQRDSWAHEFSLGWDHTFSPRSSVTVGGGPSYVDGEGVKGKWDYNVYLDYTYDFTQSSFTLFLEKKYDTQNFSGSTVDAGFKDTYNARVRYNHQFTQGLSADIFARYRWESNLDPQGEALAEASGEVAPLEEESIGDITYDKNIYEIGFGVIYDFLRYYQASLQYTYYVSDGERDLDQYNDHRILVKLTGSLDLWRW